MKRPEKRGGLKSSLRTMMMRGMTLNIISEFTCNVLPILLNQHKKWHIINPSICSSVGVGFLSSPLVDLTVPPILGMA